MKENKLCELIVFNSKGKSDLSILNLKENGNGELFEKSYFTRCKNFKII